MCPWKIVDKVNFMKMRRTVLFGLLIVVISALVISNMLTYPDRTALALSPTGYFRFVHASPDAPAIDIYLTLPDNQPNTPTVGNLGFGQATDFIELPALKYHLAVRPANAPVTAKPVYEGDFELTDGVSLNIIANGLLKANSFTLSTFVSDRSLTNGSARLEAIQLSPDAPSLDVLSGGNVAIGGLDFGKMANAPLTYKPGRYDFAVVQSGTKAPLLVDLPGLAMEADSIYTFLIIGLTKDQSIKHLILVSQPPNFVAGTQVATLSATTSQ
jgi:hypothetical protein